MKNLVYYNVSLKDEYSQIVKLSIEKLDKSNSNLYDVLIITTEDYFQRNFVDYKRKNLLVLQIFFQYHVSFSSTIFIIDLKNST